MDCKLIARQLVSQALELPLERISDTEKYLSLPEWDSLGQLKVILAIEKLINRDLSAVEFKRFNSIKSIAELIMEDKNETF